MSIHNSDRAYQSFLKDAGTPIGITISTIIACFFVFWILGAMCSAFKSDPNHVAYQNACVLADGDVRKVDGAHVCVKLTPITEVRWHSGLSTKESYEATQQCLALGGRIIDYSNNSYDTGCFRIEIIKELGARDDYRPTN